VVLFNAAVELFGGLYLKQYQQIAGILPEFVPRAVVYINVSHLEHCLIIPRKQSEMVF
jgi:hypothetical protein